MKKVLLAAVLVLVSAGAMAQGYHTDSRYMYNYRTGGSGNYTYNYDTSEYDSSTRGVSGNCDMRGRYGDCTIMDQSGNTRNADAKWVRRGVMEVTDEDGNTFEMRAE